YRVPGDYRELATLACREHLNIHRLAELRPTSIHDLIARCDGFRRPERIEQLAKVCQADAQGRLGHETEPYPQAALLRSAQAAARAVGTADIDTHDLRGPKIGERLRQARINAIRACLN
ncbi:MAG TPA: multifunctional CCA tRNA nucleotidyl transferase/2'3'-cyclic phosphodiesterase/2'nucleotidase/phosphatase, partial [Xanthomonadales bacterium]|nr:multifunctional CCA tRNA nucleotidyl transferase/2'3'-cyclic phosphodiesterase/2'nucleotidase/phosphatase [Xanthomonadales bacterium]